MYHKLDNGKFLINDYGKYGSGLTFISPEEKVVYSKFKPGWTDREYEALRGSFFISRKGNKCFRIGDGKHILLKERGDSSFGIVSGTSLQEYNSIRAGTYFKHARSNGGGQWTDYLIITDSYEPMEDSSQYEPVDLSGKILYIYSYENDGKEEDALKGLDVVKIKYPCKISDIMPYIEQGVKVVVDIKLYLFGLKLKKYTKIKWLCRDDKRYLYSKYIIVDENT